MQCLEIAMALDILHIFIVPWPQYLAINDSSNVCDNDTKLRNY